MSKIKEVHSKPRLHVSVNLLLGGWLPWSPELRYNRSLNSVTLLIILSLSVYKLIIPGSIVIVTLAKELLLINVASRKITKLKIISIEYH